jgi:probable DNA metabolism protein
VGTAIYKYIRIGLNIGRKVISFLQNQDVLWVHDMSSKVLAETHLFIGILRFKKLNNGIYYARIEPDNNITMFLSGHFAERLSDQPWIIHDAKRCNYALFDTEQVVFSNEHLPIPEDKQDEEFELLWRRYFKAIAIESRYNPKLQKQFMPRRYWKNLIEKQGI